MLAGEERQLWEKGGGWLKAAVMEAAAAYQEGPIVVQFPQQNAAVVEEVEGVDTGVQLS